MKQAATRADIQSALTNATSSDRTRFFRIWYETHLGSVNARTAQEHRDGRILIQRLATDLDDKLFFLRRDRNIADDDLHVDPETTAANIQHAGVLAGQLIARLDALGTPAPNPEPDEPSPSDDHPDADESSNRA